MRIFISYSVADTDLLKQVAAAIRAGGDHPLCWATSRVPGKRAWGSIFEWIDASDLVVAIITDKTVKRAMSVGQELGHARAKGKPIVPLVAADVPQDELGCLNGVIYQQISRENPAPALLAVQRVIYRMKLRKAEAEKQLLMLGGLVSVLFLLGKKV